MQPSSPRNVFNIPFHPGNALKPYGCFVALGGGIVPFEL
jgi:hypothetical protein